MNPSSCTKPYPSRGEIRDPHFYYVLGATSATGNIGVVRVLLLAARHDVTYMASSLNHGFDTAIEAGQDEIALLLIQNGTELTDERLLVAIFHKRMTPARAMLDAGVEIIDRGGESPPLLEKAIRWGERGLIDELISKDAYVNTSYRSKASSSPLLAAIETHDTALVKQFLDAGAIIDEFFDPPYRIDFYEIITQWEHVPSALTNASRFCDTETVRLLLDYGAEPNDVVALSAAILNDDKETFNLLL